jgi:hypothetical protein
LPFPGYRYHILNKSKKDFVTKFREMFCKGKGENDNKHFEHFFHETNRFLTAITNTGKLVGGDFDAKIDL